MKFMSSNKLKIDQYRRWLCGNVDFAAGPDLKEISSYPEAVAIYKSLMSGPDTMIDDTSLYVFARPDLRPEEIRWNEQELFEATNLDGTTIRSEVWLGVNDGQYITTYRGFTNGVWKKPDVIPDDCSDFDIGFIPYDEKDNLTLYSLLKTRTPYGDSFSSRFRACQNYIKGNTSLVIKIDDIPDWTGKWQK